MFGPKTVNDIIAPLNKLVDQLQKHSQTKHQEQMQHAAAAIAAGEEATRAAVISGNILKVIGDDKFLVDPEHLPIPQTETT